MIYGEQLPNGDNVIASAHAATRNYRIKSLLRRSTVQRSDLILTYM